MSDSQSKSSPGDTFLKQNSAATAYAVFLNSAIWEQRRALLKSPLTLCWITLSQIRVSTSSAQSRISDSDEREFYWMMPVGKYSLMYCPSTLPTLNRRFIRKWDIFITESSTLPLVRVIQVFYIWNHEMPRRLDTNSWHWHFVVR